MFGLIVPPWVGWRKRFDARVIGLRRPELHLTLSNECVSFSCCGPPQPANDRHPLGWRRPPGELYSSSRGVHSRRSTGGVGAFPNNRNKEVLRTTEQGLALWHLLWGSKRRRGRRDPVCAPSGEQCDLGGERAPLGGGSGAANIRPCIRLGCDRQGRLDREIRAASILGRAGQATDRPLDSNKYGMPARRLGYLLWGARVPQQTHPFQLSTGVRPSEGPASALARFWSRDQGGMGHRAVWTLCLHSLGTRKDSLWGALPCCHPSPPRSSAKVPLFSCSVRRETWTRSSGARCGPCQSIPSGVVRVPLIVLVPFCSISFKIIVFT